MNSDTEDMLLASHCMLMSLLKQLALANLISADQMMGLTGDAEEFLAGLDPALMSPSARNYAKTVLQRMGKMSL